MKYWKGKEGTEKFGQCGTMNDDDFVPDSFECSKGEYEVWQASLPIPPVKRQILKLKNTETGEETQYEILR